MVSNKQSIEYLDISINSNSSEKCLGIIGCLGGIRDVAVTRILEVGPGGGAALDGLADYVEQNETEPIQVDILENFISKSWALQQARHRLNSLGVPTTQIAGDLTRTPFKANSFDAVNASSVMHEVYSYGGNYEGLNNAIAEISRILKPGGNFIYREVYPVDANLQTLVRQSFGLNSWKQFVKLFLPKYMSSAPHPYQPQEIGLQEIDGKLEGTIPVGLARDIQRHYITFRDELWRSGLLGFRPTTNTYRETEWLDEARTNKKIYYEFTGSPQISKMATFPKDIFAGEDAGGQYAEGELFDAVTDEVIGYALEKLRDDERLSSLVASWLHREGPEVYVYDNVDSFIQRVRTVSSKENDDDYLLELEPESVKVVARDYYSAYLKRALGEHALSDAKILMSFTKCKAT